MKREYSGSVLRGACIIWLRSTNATGIGEELWERNLHTRGDFCLDAWVRGIGMASAIMYVRRAGIVLVLVKCIARRRHRKVRNAAEADPPAPIAEDVRGGGVLLRQSELKQSNPRNA